MNVNNNNNYIYNKTSKTATAIKSTFMIAAALLVSLFLITTSVISIPSILAASSSLSSIIPVRHAKCPVGTSHNYTTATDVKQIQNAQQVLPLTKQAGDVKELFSLHVLKEISM